MAKILLTILFWISFTLNNSCILNTNKDIEYLKVVSFGKAELRTEYNKDIGAYCYAYFNSQNDSLIYRELVDIRESKPHYIYSTYKGVASDLINNDTVINAMNLIRSLPNGALRETVYPDDRSSVYCGAEMYVEFRQNGKEHYVYFLESLQYPQLNNFVQYISRLGKARWHKKLIENNTLNIDSIVIPVLKKVGLYDSIVPIEVDSNENMIRPR